MDRRYHYLLHLLVLIAVNQIIDHGKVLETRKFDVTVISVNSGGRGATVYLVKLPDGRTMTLSGPRLPLYPAGSTVPVSVDQFADGTTRYRMAN